MEAVGRIGVVDGDGVAATIEVVGAAIVVALVDSTGVDLAADSAEAVSVAGVSTVVVLVVTGAALVGTEVASAEDTVVVADIANKCQNTGNGGSCWK